MLWRIQISSGALCKIVARSSSPSRKRKNPLVPPATQPRVLPSRRRLAAPDSPPRHPGNCKQQLRAFAYFPSPAGVHVVFTLFYLMSAACCVVWRSIQNLRFIRCCLDASQGAKDRCFDSLIRLFALQLDWILAVNAKN